MEPSRGAEPTRILNDPDGLVNLQNLTQEVERIALDDKSVPIVLGRYSKYS